MTVPSTNDIDNPKLGVANEKGAEEILGLTPFFRVSRLEIPFLALNSERCQTTVSVASDGEIGLSCGGSAR